MAVYSVKILSNFVIFFSVLLCVVTVTTRLFAQEYNDASVDVNISEKQRRSLAQSFVSKLKARLDDIDNQMQVSGFAKNSNILPDGENLLFEAVLAKKIRVDGGILGRVYNGMVLLSLRDIGDVLQLPISIDSDKKTAQGWYIREERKFDLDLNSKIVTTDVGAFNVSDNFVIEGDDILVPAQELASWVDFNIRTDVSTQELHIVSSELLPIQERYLRRNNRRNGYELPEPSLPLGGEDYKAIDVPIVNVATRSTYRKNDGENEGQSNHSASISTAGDFAHGTLSTRAQINNKDQLKNFRANYKQESVDADLLGDLKARRFEVGDVITTRTPLGGNVAQEFGVRVTNTDSLRRFNTPTTNISGDASPGWDVELYRNNQLVGFREVSDDGFYSFDNVDLFLANNNFRLIFYGPQGEVREENIFVPVDRNNIADDVGTYDVSVSLSGKNTYNNRDNHQKDEDEGSLNISAFYEKPVLKETAISAGIRSSQDDGVRNAVGNVGFSTTVMQTLLNGNLAADDEGEISTELAMRHDFAEHEFSDVLSWQGAGFDVHGSGQNDEDLLKNNLSLSGPLPIKLGLRPRYNLGVNYATDTDDDYIVNTSLGMNTSIKNIFVNEELRHSTSNEADDILESSTNISGLYGRNRVRFGTNYLIKPDSELTNVLASYKRDITDKLDFEVGVNKRFETSLTEYSAKLDWQAGFIRLSPSITYNNQHDFFAGLNTRFGLLRDPSLGRAKMYDYPISNSGGVSAFVFLDKAGDGEFNDDDEPLDGVVVRAPQNGGRVITDENGVALFTRMNKLRLTDVLLDPDSLQDPTWVPGFDGVSILPREGYIAEIDFPVHISGEIDGSIYARSKDGGNDRSVSLRNIQIKLYNYEGEVEKSVFTDPTGFYYIAAVPPGRYFLIIDEKSASRGGFIRPEPQQIEIGYDGTIIYGNDIYVDVGGEDIPSTFLTDIDDYKARHPHIDFSYDDYNLVLNLGEFNSRLLMSVVWYKLRSRYSSILSGGELFVPPADSYADVKTGKHTLRVGLQDNEIAEAYDRCRAFMARELYCKVEIYPSYMKHAKID